MPDSSDYRLYLDSRFKNIDDKFEGQATHLNAEFENFHEKLDELLVDSKETKREVKLTNSRVTHLEIYKENVADKIIVERVTRAEFNELKDCTKEMSKIVSTIDNDLTEYRIIKKYPKLSGLLFAILVIGVIISIIGSATQFAKRNDEKIIIEKIEKIESDINALDITNP